MPIFQMTRRNDKYSIGLLAIALSAFPMTQEVPGQVPPVPSPVEPQSAAIPMQYAQPVPTSLPNAKPQPLRPRPTPLAAADSVRRSIKIEATVLEIKTELGVDFKLTDFAGEFSGDTSQGFAIVSGKASKAMVKAISEKHAVTTITSPKLITLSNQEATVHVGREVTLPSQKKFGAEPTPIGITLKCTPMIINNDVQLNIDFNHSTLDGDRIAQQTMKMTVKVPQGNTVILPSAGPKTLIVLLTPSSIPVTYSTRAYAEPAAVSPQSRTKSTAKLWPARRVLPPANRAGRIHSETIASIDEAMTALFPNEDLELIQLPNAIVLRGSVSKQTADQIVDIASMYVAKVINHLKILTESESMNNSDTEPSGLSIQIRSVRNEVRALRGEVKKLTAALKMNAESEYRR